MTVWWILHYPIQYIKNCWVRLLLNYNIKYICTIYTRIDTCLMSISRFSLRDKLTLRLLKLYFYVAVWSRALYIRISDWLLWRKRYLNQLTVTIYSINLSEDNNYHNGTFYKHVFYTEYICILKNWSIISIYIYIYKYVHTDVSFNPL